MKKNKKNIQKLSLLLGCLAVATLAHAQQQQVSVKSDQGKRTMILQHLQKQVSLDFLYNEDELNKYPPLSLDLRNGTLNEALSLIVKDTDLAFTIENNVVIIRRAVRSVISQQEENVLVKGTIRDEAGQAIAGATVIELTTRKIISSDKNGEYSIIAPRQGIKIKVSFIGMHSQEYTLKAADKENVVYRNFILRNAGNQLNEVIVTGYQNITQRDMVGSASSVKMAGIQIAGVNQVDKALQGRLPGVILNNSSGLVGSKPRIRVRGTSTLLGNQEPVWVVDGIIQEDPVPFNYQQLNSLTAEGPSDAIKNMVGSAVSSLNVDDIEQITVLKDAASTAIYGVKAANGVIVITTKKGTKGKSVVKYNTNWTTEQRPNYGQFNLMNSQERVAVSKEIYQRGLKFSKPPDRLSYEGLLDDLFAKRITQEQFTTSVAKLEANNMDWFGLLFRNPTSQTHSLSLSGGANKITYYGSIGYNNTKGNTIGNDQKRYMASVNLSSQWNENLRVGIKLNASRSNTKGFYKTDPFDIAFNTNRSIPAYTETGDYYFYPRPESSFGLRYNAIHEREQTGTSNQLDMTGLTVNLDYRFLKDLTWQTLFGYSYSQTAGESYATDQSYYISDKRSFEYGGALFGSAAYLRSPLPIGGVLNSTGMNNTNLTLRNSLSYSKRLRANKDGLNIMLGQEIRSSKYKGLDQVNYGYLPERGHTFSPLPLNTFTIGSAGNLIPSPNTPIHEEMLPKVTDRQSNFVSYFGTATYNMQEKYVFNANIRYDASNRFGQSTNHRFLPVWSAGFKWNIAQESLFDQWNWLDQFSTRISYGFQGNVVENYGPDLIAQLPLNAVNPISGEFQLNIKSLAYPDLRWERNKTINLGLDFAFLKNRISGTLEYYLKKGYDVIVLKKIPQEYGLLEMPINAGDVRNEGWELMINMNLIQKTNFGWNLGFNTSKAKTKVSRSSALMTNNWEVLTSGGTYKEGYAPSSIFSFDFAGLNPKNGIPMYNRLDPVQNPGALTDISKAMVYSGQLDPKFTSGITNSLRYKNLSLEAFFYVSLGNVKRLPKLYPTTTISSPSAPYPFQNLPRELVDRWQNPGDELYTNIPSLASAAESPSESAVWLPGPRTFNYQKSARGLYDYSTVRVVDADFVRLRNLALSYAFRSKQIQRWGLQSCSLTGSVSNLFYIADKRLNGQDPEVSGNSLPMPRTYSLSLNIGF